MLQVKEITAAYGPITALHGISLEVPEGSIVSVLGANGAGKTSTLRAISGLLQPGSGSIEFEGKRIDNLAPEEIASRGVVQVPEGRELFVELTVLENLRLGAYARFATGEVRPSERILAGRGRQEPAETGLTRALHLFGRLLLGRLWRLLAWLLRLLASVVLDVPWAVREAIGGFRQRRQRRREFEEALARVFDYFPILAERKNQMAGTLSGGEQQMLAIGRGLMAGPRLLLLDEPSLGLAPMVTREIFEIIQTINQKDGVSILLVEQNANLALSIADHGYVLETGSIVLSDSSENLRRNEDVRRSYLGY